MNCPVCGKEMEQGKLLAWQPRSVLSAAGRRCRCPDPDEEIHHRSERHRAGRLALFDGVCLQRNEAPRLRLPRVQEDNSGVLLIWKI